jgi:hypothetical protein
MQQTESSSTPFITQTDYIYGIKAQGALEFKKMGDLRHCYSRPCFDVSNENLSTLRTGKNLFHSVAVVNYLIMFFWMVQLISGDMFNISAVVMFVIAICHFALLVITAIFAGHIYERLESTRFSMDVFAERVNEDCGSALLPRKDFDITYKPRFITVYAFILKEKHAIVNACITLTLVFTAVILMALDQFVVKSGSGYLILFVGWTGALLRQLYADQKAFGETDIPLYTRELVDHAAYGPLGYGRR